MRSHFKDNTYVWVVWHRGKQPSEVISIEGIYKQREEALHQASKVNAEGLSPIKDRVFANILKTALPDKIERDIPRP